MYATPYTVKISTLTDQGNAVSFHTDERGAVYCDNLATVMFVDGHIATAKQGKCVLPDGTTINAATMRVVLKALAREHLARV